MNDTHELGRLFLWLNCEGWQRFGPFNWLKFVDSEQAIVDDSGAVIAIKTDHGWLTPGIYEKYCWRNPVITTNKKHPHLSHG